MRSNSSVARTPSKWTPIINQACSVALLIAGVVVLASAPLHAVPANKVIFLPRATSTYNTFLLVAGPLTIALVAEHLVRTGRRAGLSVGTTAPFWAVVVGMIVAGVGFEMFAGLIRGGTDGFGAVAALGLGIVAIGVAGRSPATATIGAFTAAMAAIAALYNVENVVYDIAGRYVPWASDNIGVCVAALIGVVLVAGGLALRFSGRRRRTPARQTG